MWSWMAKCKYWKRSQSDIFLANLDCSSLRRSSKVMMSYLCRDFTWSSLHVASPSGSELMICLGVSRMGSIEHWTRWNLSFSDSPRRIFACLLRGSYCIGVPFPSISFAFKSSLSILVVKQWNNSYYDSYVLTLFIASRICWSFFLTELSTVSPSSFGTAYICNLFPIHQDMYCVGDP